MGKTDDEQRVMINTVGPHLDGNQVWLITAGGALFAAWPAVYAAAFSGFYFAMLLALFALFFCPVGFDYRSKLGDARWRSTWDWRLLIGGAVSSLVFGVAFGNLLLGVPFYLDDLLRPYYTGSFWALLNPFALLAGFEGLLFPVVISRVPALSLGFADCTAVYFGMSLFYVVRQVRYQAAILVPFGTGLFLNELHLALIPVLAGFRFRDNAEYPSVSDHRAYRRHASKMIIMYTAVIFS